MTGAIIPFKEKEKTIRNLIEKSIPAIKAALPRHLTAERMARIAMTTIKVNPNLLNCDPMSLIAAIIESSQLGLELDSRGLAFLIPYKTRATLQVGYKGWMLLAYNSGKVSLIYAEVVYEGDVFEFEMGLNPILQHKPNLERPETAELKAVYAVARMKDGASLFTVLGRTEIERIQKSSQAKSGPWFDWTDEMWKKSAIKRLCKWLPLSPEAQRAVTLDDLAEAGLPQNLEDALDITPPGPEEKTKERIDSLKDRMKQQAPQPETPADEEPPPPEDEPSGNPGELPLAETARPHTEQQWKKLHHDAPLKLANGVEELHATICMDFKHDSAKEITFDEASKLIDLLTGLPDQPTAKKGD